MSFPDIEEKRKLVERVAGSPDFSKAARLRDFLVYVCDHTLEGRAGELHEANIGVRVFGRPEGYDTGSDNIVRVQATLLRRRLEKHFAQGGTAEPVVIDLPRGSYVPEFRVRQAASQVIPAEGAVSRRLVWGAAVLAVGACAGLAGWTLGLRAAAPAPSGMWTLLSDPARQTDVVVADAAFGLYQDLTRQSLTLAQYLSRDYIAEAGKGLPPEIARPIGLAAIRQYTGIADVRVYQQTLSRLAGHPDRIQVRFARDYTVQDLKAHNAVLIGSSRSNPWAGFFDPELNFVFAYDVRGGGGYLLNRHPQPGEQVRYESVVKDRTSGTGHALIALLPNSTRNGHVLLLAGTSMEATEAAGEFATSPQMDEFWKAHERPANFELVLRTNRLAGTSSQSSIAAFRLKH